MTVRFNPESADPPFGDWPDFDARDHRDDASRDFLKLVLTLLGIVAGGAFTLTIAAVVWVGSMVVASPHDDGRFAGSPLKEWFNKLASGKGLCCSFADGVSVADVDWDTGGNRDTQSEGGHYRVRLNGQWIDVPDAAVVTEPNKFGPAVVWPFQDMLGKTQIRCFMPGAGT